MIPFYSTKERIDRLEEVAASWVGTPWRPNGQHKGNGVSCHFLIAKILFESGFPERPIPKGSPRWDSAPDPRSLIAEFLEADPGFEKLEFNFPADQLAPGSILGFQIGNKIQHCGMVLRDLQFVHCFARIGTAIHPLLDPTYLKRLKAVYIPLEQ